MGYKNIYFLGEKEQKEISEYLKLTTEKIETLQKTIEIYKQQRTLIINNKIKNMLDKKEIIEFDHFSLRTLKALYERALEEKKEVFTFRGKNMLTSYAKYLIEFLEKQMN